MTKPTTAPRTSDRALCETCGATTAVPLVISPKPGPVKVWTCQACDPNNGNDHPPGTESAWLIVMEGMVDQAGHGVATGASAKHRDAATAKQAALRERFYAD